MKQQPVKRIFYSSQETAEIFLCSLATISRAAADGRLPCVRIGKALLFPKAKIDAMIGLTENAEA